MPAESSLPRISDRVCELLEELTAGLALQLGVAQPDRLEYEVIVGIAQTQAGPQPIVQILFMAPSPLLGRQNWSIAVVPVALVSEVAVRQALEQIFTGLAQTYNDQLMAR